MSVEGPRSTTRTVAVWRSRWLPASETFVRHHVESLEQWRPVALGFYSEDSPLASDDDEVLLGAPPAKRLPRLAARVAGRGRLLRRLRADPPQIVHAHFGHEASAVLRPCRRLGIPLLVTLHGWDVTAGPELPGLRGALHRRRLRAVFRRSTRILAVSRFIAERAVRLGADPGKVVVHYLGIPVPPAPDTADAAPVDVVFAGRLVEKKGVDDLLDAVERHAAHARVLVVGDGPLRPELERRAAAAGLDVTFTGALPPQDLRARVASAKLFVAPSRTAADGDAEGFGLVFLEAAAAGVPVVSYTHGGVPEAVEDGRTGLLVPERDVDALGRAIGRLLADPGERQRLGAAGRRRVEDEFDIRRRSRDLEHLYSAVAAEASAHRRAS